MQLELHMPCRLLNVYTKFQIDISKHVEEKFRKHGRTDGQMDGRTWPQHNTSVFQKFILINEAMIAKNGFDLLLAVN